MKKRVISTLLGLSMIVGIMPTLTLAISIEMKPVTESATPVESSASVCPVCQTENCTKSHVFCKTCEIYDCGVDHTAVPASDPETCTTCGQAIESCTCSNETTTCDKCGNASADCTCEPEVTPCPTCGAENCESSHENWCEICKKDNCGEDHSTSTTCTTCGKADCNGQHENWCDICRKDDCGKTHVFCETCQIYDCGIPEHAVIPADEGKEGDGEQELSFYETLLVATRLKELTDLLENTDNNAEIAALTYDQLTQVESKVEELYNSSNKDEADTNKYTWLTGTLNNLKAQAANTFTELLATCSCSANKSRYAVHENSCTAYIPLPGAKVTELDITKIDASEAVDGNELPVTFAMQFETLESYDQKQLDYYGPWRADFVVTTNKAVSGKDAYLIGAYDLYNDGKWVKISFNESTMLPANDPLRLISGITDWASLFTFKNVNDLLKTFKCGIWVDPEYLAKPENAGFSVKVELRLYPVDAENNCDYSVSYPLSTINYQSETATIIYTAGEHGSVDKTTETVGTLVHPSGSTPTANDGYHFSGWYSDAEYNNAVPSDWVIAATGKLIPGTNDSGTYDSATYYAKFDPDTVDLKFELSGGKDTSTYLFTLTGENVNLKLAANGGETITIQDLPAGEYTITPDNNWNWRETVSVTVTGALTQEDATSAVTITGNGRKQWFNGYADDKN